MNGLKITLTADQTQEAAARYIRSLFKDTVKVRVDTIEVDRYGQATVTLK